MSNKEKLPPGIIAFRKISTSEIIDKQTFGWWFEVLYNLPEDFTIYSIQVNGFKFSINDCIIFKYSKTKAKIVRLYYEDNEWCASLDSGSWDRVEDLMKMAKPKDSPEDDGFEYNKQAIKNMAKERDELYSENILLREKLKRLQVPSDVDPSYWTGDQVFAILQAAIKIYNEKE